MQQILYGSICLSDIPKEEIKAIQCKDGKRRLFLNVSVIERKERSQFGHTHFVTCSPRKEERREGVNYIIGDLKTHEPQPSAPSPEEVAAAPAATREDFDDLPF